MTDVDIILLSRFYQISKISVMQYEHFLTKIKPEYQTIISNQMTNYDVLSKECCTLAKSHNISLPDHLFFKRCKQVIDDNLCSIKINLDTIIACLSIGRLHTLTEIYDVEQANSETVLIGKHLLALQDNNLQTLLQLKNQ